MKRSTWRVWLVMGLCAGALFLARAAESSLQLPEEIAKLVRKAFPEAEIIRSSHEAHHDDLTYKVRLKNVTDGRGIRVEVKSESGITRIEEEINPDELPPKVQNALRKAFPDAPVVQSQKESEIRVAYEIDVMVGDKRREIRISPRGKVLDVD
jgi:hypothetical protein